MRQRLRPAHSPEKLAELYAKPHEHERYPDHVLRVRETLTLIGEMFPDGVHGTVADLSCGDAAIADGLATPQGRPSWVYLGDIAPGYQFHGPIEETIWQIPPVDLFLCCETLEHLDDPDKVLARIRLKATALVLSTPDCEANDANIEHYWRWDWGGVNDMLLATSWEPVISRTITWRDENNWPWSYQIWGCR